MSRVSPRVFMHLYYLKHIKNLLFLNNLYFKTVEREFLIFAFFFLYPVYIEHHGISLCEILKQNLKLKFETNQIAAGQYGRISKTIKKLKHRL